MTVSATMAFRCITPSHPLILASASSRRKQLLRQLAIPFVAKPSRIAEALAGQPPQSLCRQLAEAKARDVWERSRPGWVLGADTLVVAGGHTLGKPGHAKEACEMLARLSGREHQVVTGFALIDPAGSLCHAQTLTTRVRFRELSAQEIEAYVRTGEPFGKAGGYAIQGIGAFMVEGIRGSYTNVVGLPLCAVVSTLRTAGALKTFPLTP